jgi:hypothetical protein
MSVNEIFYNFLQYWYKVRLILPPEISHHHASEMKFCDELMNPTVLQLLSFKQGDQ